MFVGVRNNAIVFPLLSFVDKNKTFRVSIDICHPSNIAFNITKCIVRQLCLSHPTFVVSHCSCDKVYHKQEVCIFTDCNSSPKCPDAWSWERAHHMHQRDMQSVGTYPFPYLLAVSYCRHRNHYCTIVSVLDIRHVGTKETIVHYMN